MEHVTLLLYINTNICKKLCVGDKSQHTQICTHTHYKLSYKQFWFIDLDLQSQPWTIKLYIYIKSQIPKINAQDIVYTIFWVSATSQWPWPSTSSTHILENYFLQTYMKSPYHSHTTLWMQLSTSHGSEWPPKWPWHLTHLGHMTVIRLIDHPMLSIKTRQCL